MERPILFSGPMVRAILSGSKTQTRRVVKPPRGAEFEIEFGWPVVECFDLEMRPIPCPYGTEGTRLWVKETFADTEQAGDHPADAYYVYRADDPDWETCEGWRWRPSIFMPRRASRITLEVTDVRVERLQAISEADAMAEGCTHHHDPGGDGQNVIEQYAYLWDAINAKRGHSWAMNPWVWAITFRRVEDKT
jgi:hypothetical protein